MTNDEIKQTLSYDLLNKAQEIMLSRRKEYGNVVDIFNESSNMVAFLSNEKVSASACVSVFIGIKLSRISTIITSGNIDSNVLKDSIIDLINYLTIFYEVICKTKLLTLTVGIPDNQVEDAHITNL